MAINVTVRDIVNFPGGTPKTVTLDIAQIVPVGGTPLEGDEIWVTSAATSATASGGGSIQTIFKNILKRGWLKGVPLAAGLIDIPSNYGIKVAIDETLGQGVDVQLSEGNNLLPEDVAADLEEKLNAQARVGGGGAKIGDLSYLNCQVRFQNGRFSIESGTVTDTFTGTGRSSVQVGAPNLLSDARGLLGLGVVLTSENLAARQVVETDLTAPYTSGNQLTIRSTAGLSEGDAFIVTDGINTSSALVSGTLSASSIGFVVSSGVAGLSNTFADGSFLRKLHEVDQADPVSAVTTIDELYRFSIDSIVNQINFAS